MSANMGERIEAVARALHGDWQLRTPRAPGWDELQGETPEVAPLGGFFESKAYFFAEAREFVIAHDVLVALDKGARDAL